MATQYDPIAKDESLNTTESPSRNVADVLAEELQNIASAIGGGGGGGHTIISPDGTSMAQRAGLGFTDAHISDDAVNDETVVEIVEGISKTDWDNLDPTDPSNNGLYEITDPNDTPILDDTQVAHGNSTVNAAINALEAEVNRGSVSVTADGVKTYGTLLDELYALIDQSKLGVNSWLNASDDTYHRLFRCVNNVIRFTSIESDANSATDLTYNFNLKSSGSQFFINWIESSSHDDRSTRVPSDGSKLTVYY